LYVEQGELEDSVGRLENYEIEGTISKVRSAGKQLRDDTTSAINRFKMNWVESLIERYRRSPGRPVVHLSDLLDSTQVGVRSDARKILLEYWSRIGQLPSISVGSERFRRIRELVNTNVPRLARLDTWKLFGSLTGFKVDDLEPYVNRLRISGGRHMRIVERPKLPFNLATISGARLIGYQGDANSQNAAFSNRNRILHEDYAACVREVVGGITITRTVLNRGGFSEGTYFRTNVGKLITSVTRVADLDNSVDQKLANNPLPLWLHVCDPSLIAACISTLWDAEGSINFRDLKLAQAVPLAPGEEWGIPNWPRNIPFRQLSYELQSKMISNPPFLLVSAALLLRRLGIISRLLAVKASMTSTGPTAYWHLRVHKDESINRFRSQIKLLSGSKARALEVNS